MSGGRRRAGVDPVLGDGGALEEPEATADATPEVPDLGVRELVTRLMDGAGVVANRDLIANILATGVRLGGGAADRLDLKITEAAIGELADAFEVFAPYRDVPKVTIFGSARTRPDAPVYAQARDAARALADAGWMVVTGAGPGIMAAGQEGAGPGRSFGVNIRLPFESGANAFIASDPKLVEMKYFFTRKVMLMKESDGFLILPGGFGTLDEGFELLTLLQTGKAQPAPIVLLDVPEDSYWGTWTSFIQAEVATRGLISPEDASLWRVTDNAQEAADEILGFYRNYHSSRWVGDLLVLRLQSAPTKAEVSELSKRFGYLSANGRIQASGPLPVEVRSRDHADLPRLLLRFNHTSYAGLRQLIDAVNALGSAPQQATPPAP
ncbi:MAG TPA: TIGR00730 family Rossman fold protein [Acidimicrobiales bacterium]|nr:TIGR00730 family Rossman fold protein [Acidimicrobiales bacterium]